MQSSQRCFKLFLLLMLLLAAINMIEGRGGGGGRRGGGLFSWRKAKKTSLSVSSPRRQSNGGGQVSGSLGSSVAYKPLKSVAQSKPQTPYKANTQQLPAGATYHASGSSLPQGATYHSHGYPRSSGVLNGGAIPAGGIFYANAAALPPNAMFYSQPPRSTFSPGNFLIGMYAGHMLGQGLFGHRSYALHAQHGNNEQHQDNNDKVVIIENGVAKSVAGVESGNATFNQANDFNNEELPLGAKLNSTFVLDNSVEEQNSTEFKDTITSVQNSTEHGIICFPLMVNETVEGGDGESVRQVEKIVCYPAPPPVSSNQSTSIPQSEASAGIICVPRKEIETNLTDSFETTVTAKQDCYPATSLAEESVATKSPDSVIGNISSDEETTTAEQLEAVVTRRQTQTAHDGQQKEEERAMEDLVKQFQHETFREELYIGDKDNFHISASQCYMLQPLYAILLPFIVLLSF